MVAWLLGRAALPEHQGGSADKKAAEKDLEKLDNVGSPTAQATSAHAAIDDDAALPKRQLSEDRDAEVWKKDGSNGHYHSKSSLCLVMWAQILYIVSLVIIIPTAARYAAALGATGTIYFGLIVGISSVADPLVCRVWNSVLKVTSLRTVLLMNASINMVSSLAYVLASFAPATAAVPMLLASRCILGLGSVQTAYLQYLGRGVSNKKVPLAHFLTTASISYGFAFGICLAFGLSAVATYLNWSQNLAPGWFTALLWLLYIPMHCLLFVEPDPQAGIVDPESKIRLAKEMRPKFRREPLAGLIPCFVAIFVIAVVTSAFEVMTIEATKHVWHLDVMTSALFLGVVMFVVALTTLLAYVMQKSVGESCTFFYGLVAAMVLLPIYSIPVAQQSQSFVRSPGGMILYLVISILTLSFLNVGRTIAFSLMTELPSPQWRDYFLGHSSSLFTLGRGVGPILVGALVQSWILLAVLLTGCLVATLFVAGAYCSGKLEHNEHELGPARAEPEDMQQNIADQLGWNGFKGATDDSAKQSACTPSRPKLLGSRQGLDVGKQVNLHESGAGVDGGEQSHQASKIVAVFD